MAVKLRLRREGAKKKPHFRVVAADHRSPRDGRFIEILGEYHPAEDPSRIEIDEERALYWLRNGAQPTDQVKTLLRIIGVWETFKPGDAPKRDRSSREAERAAKQAKKAAAKQPAEEPAAEAEAEEPAAEPEEPAAASEAPESEAPEAEEPETEAEGTPEPASSDDAPQAAAPEEVADEDPESETAEPVAEVQGETPDATAAEPSPTQDADEDTEEQS